jgi:hypothetical protein
MRQKGGKRPFFCKKRGKKEKNSQNNLVYIINLFTFAAQTGNATPIPPLLQEEGGGEEKNRKWKIDY